MKAIILARSMHTGLIGENNKLPWKLPLDLKYFKEVTKDSILIMGRHTYESLPGMLPGRIHCVISSRIYLVDDVPDSKKFLMSQDLGKAVEYFEQQQPDKNIFFIGGPRIWYEALALGLVDEVHLTSVDDCYQLPDSNNNLVFYKDNFGDKFEDVDLSDPLQTNGYTIQISRFSKKCK